MITLSHMQAVSMTSKLGIETMPSNYREFGRSMGFANADTGLYRAVMGSVDDRQGDRDGSGA